MLSLMEALASAGLSFAALVDNENENVDRWKKVASKLGSKLLQWTSGCTEENVIAAIGDDKLENLIKDSEGDFDGYRLRTIADRLRIKDKDMSSISEALKDQGRTLRELIISAATGSKEGASGKDEGKAWEKHAKSWFKSLEGGRELAIRMYQLDAWDALRPHMVPLINEILVASGQPTVDDVKP